MKFDFGRSLSIRYRLTFLMLMISVTTLLVSSLMMGKRHFEDLQKQTISKAQLQASLIGAGVESALLAGDQEAAHTILQTLRRNPTIEFAFIIIPGKSAFAEYFKNPKMERPSHSFNAPIKLGTRYLDILQEISPTGAVRGHIAMRSNLKFLNRQRQQYKKRLMVAFFLSLSVAFVISLYARKVITTPLEMMARFTQTFRKTKKYGKRIPLKYGGEFNVLAASFNHMLNVLQSREHELLVHGKQLQDMLIARTKELYQKAHFDELTGLANRSLLTERVEQALSNAGQNGGKLGLLSISLYQFNQMKERLGGAVCAQLLRAVSDRLKAATGESEILSHVGGGEFAILADKVRTEEDVVRIAQTTISAMADPFEVDSHVLHLEANVGISSFPGDSTNSDELFEHAELSLQHAVKQGPGQYSPFHHSMTEASSERAELEQQIREALEKQEFKLVFQPQVNVVDASISKVEALLRWESEALGYMSPDQFIPIAEEMGFLNQIGTWVISEVCRQIRQWADEGAADMCVALNISASHLLSEEIVTHITDEVTNNDIHFEQLEIEITEAVFLDKSDRTLGILNQLQGLGLRIAIDDFGTGYTSLRYLQEFPVDALKIDGMFIRDLETNATNQGIVTSTIALAEGLGLTLVAENVETKAQLDFLREQGCEVVQGYYFFKALPHEEVLKLMLAANKVDEAEVEAETDKDAEMDDEENERPAA